MKLFDPSIIPAHAANSKKYLVNSLSIRDFLFGACAGSSFGISGYFRDFFCSFYSIFSKSSLLLDELAVSRAAGETES
jgi:hypothetical protein